MPDDRSNGGDAPEANRLPPIPLPPPDANEPSDTAVLWGIVLVLVCCGGLGFALLIASIIADWK